MPTETPRLPIVSAALAKEALHPAHFVWERGCVGSLLGLVVGPLSAGGMLTQLPQWIPYPINTWLAVSLGGLIVSAFQGVFIRKAIPVSGIWLLTSTLSWLAVAVSLFWLVQVQPLILGLYVVALANGIVSSCQYILLRARLSSAWQWVLMNTLLGVLLWGAPAVIIGILLH